VKFQTWKTEALMVKEAPLADYQKKSGNAWASQYAMAKSLELSQGDFARIKAYCNTIGIRFLSTPDEEESLDFLVDELGMDLIKIGSAEVTNLPFLAKVGRKQRDIILSTGMATMEEVERAFATLIDTGARSISLLHCTSNYPAPIHEVNLKAMVTLRERFAVPVGYSDHTEGTEVAVAAVALGATVIEKHLTLDRSMAGPDHQASVEPETFGRMVTAIRNIEQALGDGIKRIQPSEESTRKVVMKSLVAAAPIRKGEPFTSDNVTTRRAGKGIPASEWTKVENRIAPRDFKPDEPIALA
jgi:N,N'-diacetyllegionaminate synthase